MEEFFSESAPITPAFLRHWAKWFALILAGLSAMVIPALLFIESNRVKIILSREISGLVAAEQIIRSMFQERIGDIRLLTQVPDVAAYLKQDNEGTRTSVSGLFQSFCRSYGSYDQIRMIHPDGQELIRVNLANGQCADIPQTELQSKFNRDYFRETLNLKSGQVYVSPLDLNIEHGRIEKPHKPAIRFAAPVVDVYGIVTAVLVTNFQAKNLLDTIFPAKETHEASHAYTEYLLNDEGYYLKSGEAPAREFGFMFGHEQDTFAKDYPEAWQALLQGEESVRTDAGLFLFRTLNVPVSPQPGSDTSRSRWHLVHFIPSTSLLNGSLLYGPSSPYLYLFNILLAAAVSALIARLQVRKRELRTARRTFEILFADAPEGILAIDTAGRIVMANHRANEQFGYVHEELVGREVELLVPERLRDAHIGHRQAYQRHPGKREMASGRDLRCRRKDGSEFPAMISLNALNTPRGRMMINIVRDISDIKETERLQVEARQQTEAAHQAKSDFLANMSHELRTPLHQIKGMAHLIRRDPLTPRQVDRMEKLDSATQHMGTLIETILKLTQLDAEQLELEEKPVAIADLLGEMESSLHDTLAAKGLQLKIETDGVPTNVLGDASHIRQALLHYLDNAVRFTEVGHVVIRVKSVEEDATSMLLRFEVEDTGIGVAPDVLPRLFGIFEQNDNSSTRQYGGMGVGLASAKKIAQLMGGDAGCVSKLGEGSTFWLTVRLKKSTKTGS